MRFSRFVGAGGIGPVLVAVALALACVTASRGIRDEGAVSLQGDMPRYMMNAAFIGDFLGEPVLTLAGVTEYATHYFARYPALSLGHHPPLTSLAIVPFFAALGPSVMAARLPILAFFLLATWLVYTLTRRQFDERTAGCAALLFATNPFIAAHAQVVMSEMPTVAIVLGALNALCRFRQSGRVLDFVLFMALVVLSLTAKQTAVFVFPVYALLLLRQGGWRVLTGKAVRPWTFAAMGIVLATAIGTALLSPFNVALVLRVFRGGLGLTEWRSTLDQLVWGQLTLAFFALVVGALALAVVRRDRRITLPVLWIMSVVCGVFVITGPWDSARYGILAIPAYCMFAATIAAAGPRGSAAWGTAVVIAVASVQVVAGSSVRPDGATGYEEAARAVLTDPAAPTVLYSASVDTGFFVFFVRKHDPERRLVVLRSDKIFTTSLMRQVSVESRITSRDEIYSMLVEYGTKFVVIEDRPSGSKELDWLRDEAKGDRFVERKRIPIGTTDRRLQGVDLVVYEYKDAQPADPAAELDMNLPLVGREIRVRLSDLISTGAN